MHELSIMEEALLRAFEETRHVGAHRIHRITMRIGEISGVVPEALRFAFDVATQNTIAEGADFQVEVVPVKCRCRTCGNAFQPSDFIYECPTCGALSSDVLQGREIELTSLEVS